MNRQINYNNNIIFKKYYNNTFRISANYPPIRTNYPQYHFPQITRCDFPQFHSRHTPDNVEFQRTWPGLTAVTPPTMSSSKKLGLV